MKMEFGLVETRELNGYLFKMYDAEWGYFVEVWRDGEKVTEEYLECLRINCTLTDDELMTLVETNRHDRDFYS